MGRHAFHLMDGTHAPAWATRLSATSRPNADEEDMAHPCKATHVAALLCFLSPGLAHGADADGWEWMAAPYIWAPSVGTDLDSPPISTDTRFADLIDKIDGAFLGRFEGQNERFGFLGDVVYLGLADDHSFQRFRTSSDLDLLLVDLAAVWSPGSGYMEGFEAFGGLRYIDVDLGTRFAPDNPNLPTLRADVDAGFSDALIGARYIWRFRERWSASLRGDGSFGDTDGTWSAMATVGYRVKYGEWLLGYRYLSVELENGRNKVDITFDGFMAGFGFRF